MPVANSVSVTAGSAIVTGYLTTFVGAPSDTFRLLGLDVSILNVDNTAHITLKHPWPGATLTDETEWEIAPGPYWSSVATVNSRVTDLLNKISAGVPFRVGATGTLAGRAAHDAQPENFVYLQDDVSPKLIYTKKSGTSGDWSVPISFQGEPGWSPVIAVATDGTRRVFQITDWTGGAGTKPALGYIGPTGIVSTAADAIDVRGAVGPTSTTPGPQGDKGWSPIFGIATDGTRRVLQLIDWSGGAGTKPAILSGGLAQYVAATGFTTTIGSAIDMRGATGASGTTGPQSVMSSNLAGTENFLNLVPNGNLEDGQLGGWASAGGTGTVSIVTGLLTSPFAMRLDRLTSTTGTNSITVSSGVFPVEANALYSASAFVAPTTGSNSGTGFYFFIRWLDAAGATISDSYVANNAGLFSGGVRKIGSIVQAPATAKTAKVFFYNYLTSTWRNVDIGGVRARKIEGRKIPLEDFWLEGSGHSTANKDNLDRINAFISTQGIDVGWHLKMPAGDFDLDGTTTFSRRVSLSGEGVAATKITTTNNSSATPTLYWIFPGGMGVACLDIRDFTLSETGVKGLDFFYNSAICVDSYERYVIQNLYVLNKRGSDASRGQGVVLVGCKKGVISDCLFDMHNNSALKIVGASGASSFHINDVIACNQMRYNGDLKRTFGPPAYFSGPMTSSYADGLHTLGAGPARTAATTGGGSESAGDWTIGMVVGHGFYVGEQINLQGYAATGYNIDDRYTIKAVTSNTIQVAQKAGNVGSYAAITTHGTVNSIYGGCVIDNQFGVFNEASWKVFCEGKTADGAGNVELDKGPGSAGLLIDGSRSDQSLYGHTFSGCVMDAGYTPVMLSAKAYTINKITFNGCHSLNSPYAGVFVFGGIAGLVLNGHTANPVRVTSSGQLINSAFDTSSFGLLVLPLGGLVAARGVSVNGGLWGFSIDYDIANAAFTSAYGLYVAGAGGNGVYPQFITIAGGAHFQGRVNPGVIGAAYSAAELAAAHIRVSDDNIWITGSAHDATDDFPSITVAASIDIGLAPTVNISGTGTVTTMTPAWEGREVTVLTSGAVAFATGGNFGNALASSGAEVKKAAFYRGAWFIK